MLDAIAPADAGLGTAAPIRAASPEALALTVRRTRAFARRQRMWFRRDPRITWFGTGENPAALLPALLAGWCDAMTHLSKLHATGNDFLVTTEPGHRPAMAIAARATATAASAPTASSRSAPAPGAPTAR